MSQIFGCVKNTIKLRSGKYFDFEYPQPEQFDLADITGALSKICRFGGQCKKFYSVAEHSVHCATVAKLDGLSIAMQRAALMHDAPEAFVGDMVKPLKIMLPEYVILEQKIEDVIAAKFDINFSTCKETIREIDHAMLIAERRAMFGGDSVKWYGEDQVRRLNVDFLKAAPERAEELFLDVAAELGIE